MSETKFDPVLLSVLGNAFDGVVREMTNGLLRSGRSSVLNTARDFSCSILTADSQLLAAAEGAPVHVFGSEPLSLHAPGVAERAPSRDTFIAEVTSQVTEQLKAAKIEAVVTGRPKHYYSIYQKMIVRGRDFTDIWDLVGIRILVDSVRDCYAVLGTVHTVWKPIPGRFKDYIAVPKQNMYQSIHTTVVGKGGKTRHVTIQQDVAADLRALRPDGAADSTPLFISRKGGEALTAGQVRRVVKAAAAGASIEKTVTPHWLRHAHASHALDRGCPVHVLQAQLGHASLGTTTIYAHVNGGESSGQYLAR